MSSEHFRIVRDHIAAIMPLVERQPAERIPYPFLAPGYGPYYADTIYTWDHHHMAMRFARAGRPEYLRHLVDNLLSHQVAGGYVPSTVHARRGPSCTSPPFHAQPFLMQGTWLYVAATGDKAWARKAFGGLAAYLGYYESEMSAPMGLFRWPIAYFGGFDNDVVTTFFQPDTIISCDVNAWLYMEYRAAAKLARRLNRRKQARDFSEKAARLRTRINEVLWCEQVESYSAYNLCTGQHQFSLGDPFLTDAIGRFAYQTSSNLIPLYARVADKGRAKAMIQRYVLSEDHFLSEFGTRSLSRSSEFYNNALWGNPPRFGYHRRPTNANWQGPVWAPLTYFMACALQHYRYDAEARDLAGRLWRTLAGSIQSIGSMTENFCAETGRPLNARQFASWNILADTMAEELDQGRWMQDEILDDT